MSTYILVHGAYHGAWCWHRLLPLLDAAGHDVIAPDLPGHGDDLSPMSAVSLDAYTDCIAGLVEAAAEPPTLVGHSMAGIVLSSVAERLPGAIRRLAYLTAYLLADGQRISDVARDDAESLVTAARVNVDDTDCVTVTDSVLRDAFYGDAREADFAFVRERVRTQSLAPFRAPVRVSGARFGSVPRTYIHCTGDRAIGPEAQARMVDAWPGTEIRKLDSGHSPFLTVPEKLAEVLIGL